MVLSSMTGEDLVIAVAVDISHPEGVAVGQAVVDHGPWAKLELESSPSSGVSAKLTRPRCRATARLARKRRPSPSRPRCTSLDPRLTAHSGPAPGVSDRRLARSLPTEQVHALLEAVRITEWPRRRRRSPRWHESPAGPRRRAVHVLWLGIVPGREHRAGPGRVIRRPGMRPKIGATTRSSRLSPSCRPSAGGGCCPTSAIGSRPGIVEPLPGRHQQLSVRRPVHRELIGDRDLGLAVAVEAGGRGRMYPRRLLAGVTIRFFHVGFSYRRRCFLRPQ